MSVVRLHVAGCEIAVSLFDRQGSWGQNLFDLGLPFEGIVDGGRWTVELKPGVDAAALTPSPDWSGTPESRVYRGDHFDVRFEGRAVVARYDRAHLADAGAACRIAIFGALRRAGRSDLHAAAVVAPTENRSLVLIGDSGNGKSTLTALALHSGWRVVSDDSIAVFQDGEGDAAVSPLRRSLQVTEAAAALLPEASRKGRWTNEELNKQVVDPEESGLADRRSLRARPARLVFLKRGDTKAIEPLSEAQAFRLLVRRCPHVALDPDAAGAIEALRLLARQAPACTAALPLNSLHDAATLQDLFS